MASIDHNSKYKYDAPPPSFAAAAAGSNPPAGESKKTSKYVNVDDKEKVDINRATTSVKGKKHGRHSRLKISRNASDSDTITPKDQERIVSEVKSSSSPNLLKRSESPRVTSPRNLSSNNVPAIKKNLSTSGSHSPRRLLLSGGSRVQPEPSPREFEKNEFQNYSSFDADETATLLKQIKKDIKSYEKSIKSKNFRDDLTTKITREIKEVDRAIESHEAVLTDEEIDSITPRLAGEKSIAATTSQEAIQILREFKIKYQDLLEQITHPKKN